MYRPLVQTPQAPSSCVGLRFLVIVVLSVSFLSAIATAQTAEQPLVDIYHSSWTTKDGAPRGITSLAQTQDGYLWIGTSLGLYKFDGSRFAEYPEYDDAPKLPSVTIKSLASDDSGGIWVGYDHHGISHIAAGHLTNIPLPRRFENAAVEHIYCCAQQSIWVLASDTILRWKDGSWEDLAALQSLPRSSFSALFFDQQGNIWASSPLGTYEWRKDEKRFVLTSKAANATQLAESNGGTIWANDRLGDIQPLGSKCMQPNPGKGVLSRSSFVFDSVGHVWTGSEEHGVSRSTASDASCPNLKASQFVTTANGLTSNAARAVMVDHFGDIWVGTSMGIDRFRRRIFEPFGEQDFNSYPAIASAPDGSMWIQKQGHRLLHVTDRGTHEVGLPRFLCPIFADSHSGVWLFDFYEQALLHFNAAEVLDRKIPSPGPNSSLLSQNIVSSVDGTVFVTFAQNGLWSYSDKWTQIDGNQSKSPTALMQDGDTNWAGYFDNAIVSRTNKRQKKFGVTEGVEVGTPLVMARHNDILWAAGTEGVDFLVGHRFHCLLVRAPERLRGVSGLTFDTNGDLWLNTGFGAIQIKSTEVAKALQNPDYRAITEVYGSADGVIGLPTLTWPVPSLARDAGGKLWFATAGNLVSIDPRVLSAPRSKPFVDLQFIRINGRRIAAHELTERGISLKGGRMNRIEFHFTAVDLDHPNHIIFRYWLEGEDKDWQEGGNSHMAMYSRLRPGHYAFRVAARKSDAEWTELSTPFQFDIEPTFYQTAWFLMVCMASALMCLWLLYQLRVRFITARIRDRMEERSNERLRIARDLHDTLLQSIHGLMLRFHYAASELAPDSTARLALELALKRADALILEGRNSLQELRGEAEQAKSLSELLADHVRDAAPGDGISVQISEIGIPLPVRPHVKTEFSKIGTEAIRNALSHGRAEQIRVKVHYGRRFLQLSCRDDGVGIPEDIVRSSGREGHWGLKGMQERAKSIGARFSILTNEGAGTEIEVRLCSGLAYDHATRLDRILSLLRSKPSKRLIEYSDTGNLDDGER